MTQTSSTTGASRLSEPEKQMSKASKVESCDGRDKQSLVEMAGGGELDKLLWGCDASATT